MRIKAFSILAFLIALQASGHAQSLRVVLDSTSFSMTDVPTLTKYASLTTAAINAMIPGVPDGYSQANVIVFNESPEFMTTNRISVPITLVGPKLPGEPASTRAQTIRIGVIGVEGPDVKRFVFQLSHELTHVKMGADVDNTLLEALASSASHEVLVRMHFFEYLESSITPEVLKMPPDVQRAYADTDFATLRPYWQSRCAAFWIRTNDLGCQVLGSLLLKSHPPSGSLLLNISHYTLPLPPSRNYGTQLRPPDIPALKRIGFRVDALGY